MEIFFKYFTVEVVKPSEESCYRNSQPSDALLNGVEIYTFYFSDGRALVIRLTPQDDYYYLHFSFSQARHFFSSVVLIS